MDHAWKTRASQLAFALTKRIAAIVIPLGFSFGDFSAAAKAAFVASAEMQIRNRGKRPSTAKIAILTGLTRAEVARIRTGKQASARPPEQRTERVMHGWFTDARYVDQRGAPRTLPMLGTGSFDELVRRYGADVPRKAVLEELISGGMVAQDSKNVVRALRRHHVAPKANHVDLERLAQDVEIVFASTEGAQTGHQPTLRRVTVRFSGPVPGGVKRNVSTRTERFLEALSDYLHGEAASGEKSSTSRSAQEFTILVSHTETSDPE